MASRVVRVSLIIPAAVLLLYILLLIPDSEPPVPPPAVVRSFIWNQDARWRGLEKLFLQYRSQGCARLEPGLIVGLTRLQQEIESVLSDGSGSGATAYDELERDAFALAPMVAACPDRAGQYVGLISWMRSVIKDRSADWDINDPDVRRRLYRLLYGGRAAVEEVLLQMPPSAVPQLTPGDEEPSETPSTVLLGATIHSGDILVSRGGAPTSALIARGNDFQGNFSHVAIVHVDSASGRARVIESHIERGVAVASLEEYLKDIKLRVMVLRLRRDQPLVADDPMLPHRAAQTALDRATQRHTPYDFAMDTADSSGYFCSEVVSAAYAAHGLKLWKGESTISTPGVRNWLAGFGVRNFTTIEPSDLEYDPQLRVVGEWRDPETLMKDHIDNAVVDVMLEGAERGEQIGWSRLMLPVARLVKAYSVLQNWFGGVGPVPEGMSATSALRHRWLVEEHNRVRDLVIRGVEKFKREKGYVPPYWEILAIARSARGGG